MKASWHVDLTTMDVDLAPKAEWQRGRARGEPARRPHKSQASAASTQFPSLAWTCGRLKVWAGLMEAALKQPKTAARVPTAMAVLAL
jgi:hypothetical protein